MILMQGFDSGQGTPLCQNIRFAVKEQHKLSATIISPGRIGGFVEQILSWEGFDAVETGLQSETTLFLIDRLLNLGAPLIIDAPNLSQKHSQAYIDLANKHKCKMMVVHTDSVKEGDKFDYVPFQRHVDQLEDGL